MQKWHDFFLTICMLLTEGVDLFVNEIYIITIFEFRAQTFLVFHVPPSISFSSIPHIPIVRVCPFRPISIICNNLVTKKNAEIREFNLISKCLFLFNTLRFIKF